MGYSICKKCGGLVQYNPYFKADICTDCNDFRRRIDATRMQQTVQWMSKVGAEHGICTGVLLNQAVNHALELQSTQDMSVVDACEQTLKEMVG